MLASRCMLGLMCSMLFLLNPLARAENVTLCWGDGSYGQLGNGVKFNSGSYESNVPVAVLGGRSFAAVCSGESHSCGLEATGAAWCWGKNWNGQLGDGTTNSSNTPVAVAGGHTFRSITCGYDHTCALEGSGAALCWGLNEEGRLGIGNRADSNVPVAAAEGRTFQELSAGWGHTCGVDQLGNMFCWGVNEYGQLGDGTTTSSTTAVAVAGGRIFRSISCGNDHTCALDGEGKAWCWGSGFSGLLGNGATSDRSSPVPVSGGRAFIGIAAGDLHTCAVTQAGSMRCWGISPPLEQDSTVPAEVGGDHSFLSVNAGYVSTCGLDASGDVWCFGGSDFGQLGDGSNDDSTKPVKVAGGHSFRSLGQSRAFTTCAIATQQAGSDEAPPSPTASPSSPSSPSPSRTPSPSPSQSASSAPVGAIAGGIAAGVVVLAVLAFLALRPGKGWLRRRPTAAGGRHWEHGWPNNVLPPPSSLKAGMSAVPGGQPGSGNASEAQGTAGTAGPLAAAWEHSTLGPDTLISYSRASPSILSRPDTLLPYSRMAGAPAQHYALEPTSSELPPGSSVSTAGWARGFTQPGQQPLRDSYLSSAGLSSSTAAAQSVAPLSQSTHSSSAHSLSSDVVLSFISSYLSSRATAPAQQPAPGGSAGGSGAFELGTDARRWEVQWPELTLLHLLGHGSFGFVYLAEWNQTRVAVKVLISKDDISRGQLELPERVLHDLQSEAAVMSHMRHPNVVQFMGLVAVPPAIMTEYCSRGSLYDCLKAGREQPAAAAQLTWRRRLAMAVDASMGLLYLHRRNIIHRDVKSPNLLVDDAWHVKVADFNLSKLLGEARPESSLTSTAPTNPIWMAPELLEGGSATAASDVYGFGMVLFELLTWRLPWSFANLTPFKVGATIRQGGRPEVPPREALPGPDTAGWAGLDGYLVLMRDCWAQRPADRPTFDEVVGQLRSLLADTASS